MDLQYFVWEMTCIYWPPTQHDKWPPKQGPNHSSEPWCVLSDWPPKSDTKSIGYKETWNFASCCLVYHTGALRTSTDWSIKFTFTSKWTLCGVLFYGHYGRLVVDAIVKCYNIVFGSMSDESADVNEGSYLGLKEKSVSVMQCYAQCHIINKNENGLFHWAGSNKTFHLKG